jgi:hypothetical protein
MVNKNAIGVIVFNNPLYLVGACLSAYVHRKFITKYKLNIDLIVMVDKEMYKYKDELDKYFDLVKLIDLLEMKLNQKYNVINKYSKWMKYSISKWQILNFDFYDKILFLDVDILPVKKNFYDIFNLDTPAIMIRGINTIQDSLVKPEFFMDDLDNLDNLDLKNIKNGEYFDLATKLKYSLDAGIVLLKPDKTLFNEYIDFLKICEGSYGYISKYDSGIDETTLLMFFIFYKKIPIHLIPYNYAPIPWDKFPYDKNDMRGINYLSLIKPWVKLPIIQWSDENIWHKIAKKALDKHSVITKIYIKYMIDELYNFFDNWKKNMSKSNSPYNTETFKSSNSGEMKHLIFKLMKYIKTHPKENLTIEQIEYIIEQSVLIHKLMNKKLFVPIDELEQILLD